MGRRSRGRKLVAADLFCGAGGFSLGLIQAGIEVVVGLDNNPVALTTYGYNLGADGYRWIGPLPSPRFRREWWADGGRRPPVYGDWTRGMGTPEMGVAEAMRAHRRKLGWARTVRAVICRDASEVHGWDILEAVPVARVDVVAGSPPCGSFSRVGKRRVGDPRDALVFEFVRLVQEIDPDVWVMENVPELASKRLPSGAKVIDVLNRLAREPYHGPRAREVLGLDPARLLVQSEVP